MRRGPFDRSRIAIARGESIMLFVMTVAAGPLSAVGQVICSGLEDIGGNRPGPAGVATRELQGRT
jgi:hypothetical protein